MSQTKQTKIKLEDITPEKIRQAQDIVRYVVSLQTVPANPVLGKLIVGKLCGESSLAGLHDGLRDGLEAGLDAGLADALNAGLRVGLDAGLADGLDEGLRAGVSAGLRSRLHEGLRDGLEAGLDAGLAAGLDAGANAGLAAGLDVGVNAGLRDGLAFGLADGLRDALEAGLDEGLHAGVNAGLRAGLPDKLIAGLDTGLSDGLDVELAAGLDEGLHAGVYAGLRDGVREGLAAGLDAGLRDGLDAGLRDGLRYALGDGVWAALDVGLQGGLDAGLRDALRAAFAAKLKQKLDGLRLEYCGIWWSWWLARYLIAKSWGLELDMEKLSLLWGYCIHAPLVATNKRGDVIILPKPTKISWVETGLTDGKIPLPIYELHNDGAPAVEHPLCNLYYWHNTKLPDHIGSVHSSKWESEWVLKETNTEIRKILIEQIGYDRLCQELEAKKLSTWREYELLRIDDADIEPMHLLKMTCPSTGHIHVLRVPPDQTSARKAIKWCNWGIDADEFVIET